MLSNGSSFNSTDESSQGFESMDDRESAPMGATRSSVPSRESLQIEDDEALAPWILPAGAIQDVIPNIGNISSGVYRSGRVMLMSLPEDSAEQSAQLITHVSHPKLVTFVGFTHGIAGELQVVTEWMDGGTLDALLSKQVLLGLMQKLVIALDVITGLDYLHQSMQIPHRNLSTLTIWLDDGARAKLSLWSCSEPNPVWHALEIKTSASNGSRQADMYSYGVLLWTLQRQAIPSVDELALLSTSVDLNSSKFSHGSLPDASPSASTVKNIVHSMVEEMVVLELASDIQSTTVETEADA
ncbi:hypothetical protein AC1031_000446 [Aphanomyces cochlioides]|nr:hypothetical protein AC1031_000446 [Aphanomyces cochlioides]